MTVDGPTITCVGCGKPTAPTQPLCDACLNRGLGDDLPPCVGARMRDTTHDIVLRAAFDAAGRR